MQPIYIVFSLMFLSLAIAFVYFVIWLKDDKDGKGLAGELVVAHFLNKLDKSEYKVINNLNWKTSRGSVQIDHVVVSKYGIFVLETKNWSGKVYGKFWDAKWEQYINNKKYFPKNPKYQNDWHVKKLKEVLSEYPNLEYIPLQLFSGMTERKIFKDKSIRISEVLETIHIYKEPIITELEVNEIFNKLKVLKGKSVGL